jgi:hypothetical protein
LGRAPARTMAKIMVSRILLLIFATPEGSFDIDMQREKGISCGVWR